MTSIHWPCLQKSTNILKLNLFSSCKLQGFVMNFNSSHKHSGCIISNFPPKKRSPEKKIKHYMSLSVRTIYSAPSVRHPCGSYILPSRLPNYAPKEVIFYSQHSVPYPSPAPRNLCVCVCMWGMREVLGLGRELLHRATAIAPELKFIACLLSHLLSLSLSLSLFYSTFLPRFALSIGNRRWRARS